MILQYASCCSWWWTSPLTGCPTLTEVINIFFYELPPQDKTWKRLFLRIVAACMRCVAHSMAEPQRTYMYMPVVLHACPCPTCPLFAGNVSLFLRLSTLGGRVGSRQRGAGRLWDSGAFAAGYLECCRNRGARSYQHAQRSVPRDLCQRGQEEKTHSSATQWECLHAH